MPRESFRWPVVATGGALLVAVVLTERAAADQTYLIPWLAVVALAGAVTAALAARGATRPRAWLGLAVLLALLSGAGWWAVIAGRADAEAWVEHQEGTARTILAEAVHATREHHADFTAFAVELASDSLLVDDPFVTCARWADRWRDRGGVDHDADVAVVLWRGGERLGWAGRVIPTGGMPDTAELTLLHDEHRWVLRETEPLQAGRDTWVECQLTLAPVDTDPDGAAPVAGKIRRSVVRDARPPGLRSWGDAARGLRLVQDVVLGPADQHGVRPRLRLEVQVPPRSLLADRVEAGRALVRGLTVGAALLLWAWLVGGGAGFWIAAWFTRALFARVSFFHALGALVPLDRLPAAPAEPASLLDPAYFATTFAGGWLASGADALLTAALAVGTAAWLWRRWGRTPGEPVPTGAPARRRLLWLVPAVALAALGLGRLWHEIAANANARLIGLQIPLDSWTFWALHATILMLSLAVGAVLLLVSVRLLGREPWARVPASRPFWLAGGLLLAVLFNYVILAQAYGRTERDWLQRKADQIVQPQDDWISFLLEDVLGEMAAADPDGQDPAAAGGGQGALRRDVAAYRLWRGSAVCDLGLPALVEVLDSDGESVSLFATGFLRDFGYEIVERGPWWSLAEFGEEGGGRIGVMLQDEVRRYPTGRERILRGEIPRDGDRGWLRLELPVQSLRISTLERRLAGVSDLRASGGYRPRTEIDRPLLLLRGDRDRWLDAGFGALPDPRGERLITDLRDGSREWAVIELDGRDWLCRWAPLPDGFQTSPGEGFLLGLQRRGAVELLLDVGRLLLLDVLLVGLWFAGRSVAGRRLHWLPGFQGRFLLGYLVIGVVLLVVAGSLADRQTFQRIDREARERTRDGLVTALGQLRGLLAEQARALAASDYLADLLTGRLAGDRPVGPFHVRQGMVFGPDGELLLDETLSDLDAEEAARLLAAAREGPLVAIQQPDGLYLGVLIPIDLASERETETMGAFFYRQRVDDQLLPGLADVVGGEITLRVGGEVVDASHPGRVFDGENPLLAPPELMAWFRQHPTQPHLQARASGLAFTGGLALPSLAVGADGQLVRRTLPAVLSVDFPDRERDFVGQRRSMALFLAGLITVLLLTAFGLAMVLTWNIFEPLRVLLGATRRLAAGDYSAPLPPPGGDEVGRLADGFRSMRDQLHAAQASLEARERFLRTVLDRVPVGVLVWDAEGQLAAWNPAATAILARFYPDLPTGEDAAGARLAWTARLCNDLARQLRAPGGELRSDDGRRTLRIGRAPMELGAEAPHQLLVCEDLTDFLAAKKLALNAELARQVAHEIKNPLTPIQLSVQLLQQAHADRHPKLDTIMADAIERILEQVALLRTIAGEFSLLGRPGDLACEPLDLGELVRDLVAGYGHEELGGGPRVHVQDVAVPAVLAHRESLQKVLGNLMQNSLDAVGAAAELQVTVNWRVEPGRVELVWVDNGPGIPDDVAGRLFDPYFSTKSKGTGLGLAICRNLLDKMGGTISLANRTDAAGAVATIGLPRADSAPERQQDSPTG